MACVMDGEGRDNGRPDRPCRGTTEVFLPPAHWRMRSRHSAVLVLRLRRLSLQCSPGSSTVAECAFRFRQDTSLSNALVKHGAKRVSRLAARLELTMGGGSCQILDLEWPI